VYESVYDSPDDSMNNLPKSQIGIQLFIRHLLQWSVYTFQPKLMENLIERTFGKKSYTESVYYIVYDILHKLTSYLIFK
jgi:hypothetical protein